jgi:hypothetical protein
VLKKFFSFNFLGRSSSLLAIVVLLSGCSSFYVDTATKEIPTSAFKQVAHPKPVQIMFEFQTNGKFNERATAFLKEQVIEQIKSSGLFAAEAKTSSKPAVLSVTINNVVIDKEAAAKGFATGLTFGLMGNTVADGYICTVSYLAEGQSTPIVKTAKHLIHTKIGNAKTPANVVKYPSVEAASRTMAREILSNTLHSLSHDQQFN